MSASALLFVISLLTNRYKGKHLCVYMQTKTTFFCIKILISKEKLHPPIKLLLKQFPETRLAQRINILEILEMSDIQLPKR